MVIIRTHASPETGIGHLARCRRLASRLQTIGYKVHFVVDQLNDQLEQYLSAFTFQSLYAPGQGFEQEEEDATQLLQLLGISHEVEAVLVDDYRLGTAWEEKVDQPDVPLIVIDDLERPHQCDLLIDSRWEGEKTQARYRNKVPVHAVKLLGARYLMMDEVYANGLSKHGRGEIEDDTIQLMLGLGGGGDLTLLVVLMEQILEQQPEGVTFQLRPVVGPFADHRVLLRDFAVQHAEVVPIENRDGLYRELSETDLFIGAAGGTLFEALALKIPCLTFSLSENQQNDLADLEVLGHYFHLGVVGKAQLPEMATLIWQMAQQSQRLQQLYRQPAQVTIDGQGVQRVVDQIDRLIRGKFLSQVEEELPISVETTNENQLLPVDDRSINRYLQARNLKENLRNMTDQEPAPYLSHYIWWLQCNRRKSYELQRDGRSLLYIWHQRVTIDSATVLIGGWFVASSECSPMDAMAALGQQLEITDQDYPGIPWVAVIHRENRFVQQMNRRFGFELIESDDLLFSITQACFPKATVEEFFYYVRH